MENLTSFFEHAMAFNDRTMTYMVSRRLNELFPGQAVVESYESFDVDGFVRYGAGEATLVHRMTPQYFSKWDGEERRLKRKLLTSWIEVEWRGEKFQVLRALRAECGCVHWIVGHEDQVEAFMKAVFGYTTERSPATHVYAGWWHESESMDRAIRDSHWPDMVLPKDLRKAIEDQTVGFFQAKADYDLLGVPWKRGLLLTGPPGNGKTFLIRAILNRLPVPRLVVKSFGEDPEDVQEVFDKVREMAPCVLVLEDVDSLIRKELLSSVLNALDGTEPLSGVLVLATTNHPEQLDPAIRNRPSRFDRVIEFGPPAVPERRLLLKRLFGRLPADVRPNAPQLAALAKATDGFSFAYLKELAVASAAEWLRSGRSGSLFEVARKMAPQLRTQMTASAPSEE